MKHGDEQTSILPFLSESVRPHEVDVCLTQMLFFTSCMIGGACTRQIVGYVSDSPERAFVCLCFNSMTHRIIAHVKPGITDISHQGQEEEKINTYDAHLSSSCWTHFFSTSEFLLVF